MVFFPGNDSITIAVRRAVMDERDLRVDLADDVLGRDAGGILFSLPLARGGFLFFRLMCQLILQLPRLPGRKRGLPARQLRQVTRIDMFTNAAYRR